jgi:hypothetical protein
MHTCALNFEAKADETRQGFGLRRVQTLPPRSSSKAQRTLAELIINLYNKTTFYLPDNAVEFAIVFAPLVVRKFVVKYVPRIERFAKARQVVCPKSQMNHLPKVCIEAEDADFGHANHAFWPHLNETANFPFVLYFLCLNKENMYVKCAFIF